MRRGGTDPSRVTRCAVEVGEDPDPELAPDGLGAGPPTPAAVRCISRLVSSPATPRPPDRRPGGGPSACLSTSGRPHGRVMTAACLTTCRWRGSAPPERPHDWARMADGQPSAPSTPRSSPPGCRRRCRTSSAPPTTPWETVAVQPRGSTSFCMRSWARPNRCRFIDYASVTHLRHSRHTAPSSTCRSAAHQAPLISAVQRDLQVLLAVRRSWKHPRGADHAVHQLPATAASRSPRRAARVVPQETDVVFWMTARNSGGSGRTGVPGQPHIPLVPASKPRGDAAGTRHFVMTRWPFGCKTGNRGQMTDGKVSRWIVSVVEDRPMRSRGWLTLTVLIVAAARRLR